MRLKLFATKGLFGSRRVHRMQTCVSTGPTLMHRNSYNPQSEGPAKNRPRVFMFCKPPTLFKGTSLGTLNRKTKNIVGIEYEYEDPGRYIPIIFLPYSWGSRNRIGIYLPGSLYSYSIPTIFLGVPCLGFPVKSLQCEISGSGVGDRLLRRDVRNLLCF